MAWEWSHTHEGIDNAIDNVRRLSKKDLIVILQEWNHYDKEQNENFKGTPNFRLYGGQRKLSQDALADIIVDRMVGFATCDRGGFDAWVCPYGCHIVSFSGNETRELEW